jgi:hypothetical protein
VLGHHACVIELLDVVYQWHPAHYLPVPKLPKCLKMEMPKPLVPTPGLIMLMSGEAERPSHLHVKHVQLVVPAVDLGEEATVVVPDPEHPLVNLHS